MLYLVSGALTVLMTKPKKLRLKHLFLLILWPGLYVYGFFHEWGKKRTAVADRANGIFALMDKNKWGLTEATEYYDNVLMGGQLMNKFSGDKNKFYDAN